MKRGGKIQRKGQGLPMNTVIITILVILVLVVVAAFFLGGTSQLTQKVKGIFFQSISGTDLVLASQTCQQRCDQLQLLPKTALARSAYCRDYFNIDEDNDGEAQYDTSTEPREYIRYYCYDRSRIESLSVPPRNLQVPCSIQGKNPEEYCRQGFQFQAS